MGKTRALQARVDEDFAARFSAIAKARGMTDSDLVRVALEKEVKEAQSQIDELRAALKRDYEAAQRALDSDPPAPVTANKSRTPSER